MNSKLLNRELTTAMALTMLGLLIAAPGVAEAGFIGGTFSIDCNHDEIGEGDIGNAGTSNRLTFEAHGTKGVQLGKETFNGSECNTLHDMTFDIKANQAVDIHYISVTTNGEDAFYIDEAEFDGSPSQQFGRDNGKGWCLSTDPNDAQSWASLKAGDCASTLYFDLTTGQVSTTSPAKRPIDPVRPDPASPVIDPVRPDPAPPVIDPVRPDPAPPVIGLDNKTVILRNKWGCGSDARCDHILSFHHSTGKLYREDSPADLVGWVLEPVKGTNNQFYLRNTWGCPSDGRCGDYLGLSGKAVTLVDEGDTSGRVPWQLERVPGANDRFYIRNRWQCPSDTRCDMHLAFSGLDLKLYNKDNTADLVPWEVEIVRTKPDKDPRFEAPTPRPQPPTPRPAPRPGPRPDRRD